MLYIYYGQDQFRAREELRALRARLDKDGNLAHNTVWLEARGLSAADLQTACHTASFFAEDRLVIVEGLMGRFSGARRRSGGRGRSSGSASDLDAFVEVLGNLPPTTSVVLIDEQSTAALLEALRPVAEVKQFNILKPPEVREWAQRRLRAKGADFAPAALSRLLSLIDGYHLGELASEIDKLSTYAEGRQVQLEDVDTLVHSALEMRSWDLTDAVIEGRGDRALAVLQAMDDKKQPPQMTMYSIRRQFRQLLLAQSLQQEGASQAQIGSQLGLNDYPLRKVTEQAARFPSDRLEAGYRRILQADVDVKTGILDVETALPMLIVELAELARGPGRRPRA